MTSAKKGLQTTVRANLLILFSMLHHYRLFSEFWLKRLNGRSARSGHPPLGRSRLRKDNIS
jgi:hypothetical protein